MRKSTTVIDKKFIFIIGSPRSGSTWLQAMIGTHPSVCTTVELTLFSNYTAPWIESWKNEAANIKEGRWHQGLPFLWSEEDFYSFLQEFLEKVYERVVATKPEATHILDKHPGYSAFVEEINKLIPNALFIHIIRDGRDVASSMVAARKKIGFGTDTIPASAMEWKRHLLQAKKACQYRNRYMEIRYEDLLNNGVNVLKSVFDFCNLSISSEDVAKIIDIHQFKKMKANRVTPAKNIKAPDGAYGKGRAGVWREEFKPLQMYYFDKIAGNLLVELGYAETGWWVESKFQASILPVIARSSTILKKVLRALSELFGTALTERIKKTELVRLLLERL